MRVRIAMPPENVCDCGSRIAAAGTRYSEQEGKKIGKRPRSAVDMDSGDNPLYSTQLQIEIGNLEIAKSKSRE